ncbi:MAG TPA: sulfite exporter TauE/SafE family protein [Thermoanaerobaculales bacterium]|nr:sulfite exporter TauE/SafE family protein [Thermoanaerobaculales bacterium]HPA80209.1 sulfite exporter TauE/SafE family protein [Thermoanaerobaculales bacterium]HQN95759.1 sulfite exporter TauE/SafE family protein [Thermoanaerobaculales bacterium]HQP44548.1 sulfite exporter TauE/SafE family protein [Thermoanaerobaculales bacterium]
MTPELVALVITAASIGVGHTLLGPDHYLPFVVLARARGWSRPFTVLVTTLCGIGHVGSSVVLGMVGIALGIAVARVEGIESARGDIAAWLLTAFGLVYMVWGLRRAARHRTHSHVHAHADGETHVHLHDHEQAHLHPHDHGRETPSLTPWVLFTIFVFGPCEPLIPILMYPAAADSAFGVALVAGVFGAATILTMLAIVLLLSFGLSRIPTRGLERYSHALAGLAIFLCGVAIHLGL